MRCDCVLVWAGGRRAGNGEFIFFICGLLYCFENSVPVGLPREAQTSTLIGIMPYIFGHIVILTAIIEIVMRHFFENTKTASEGA
jgi:hypothetical protein